MGSLSILPQPLRTPVTVGQRVGWPWRRWSPGLLGKRLGLTSGSVTAMLDRMEKLGHLSRSPDPADRRRVAVRITPEASRKAWESYGPIAEEGSRFLAEYTTPQLRLVIDFLRRSRQLYDVHLVRVRNLSSTDEAAER